MNKACAYLGWFSNRKRSPQHKHIVAPLKGGPHRNCSAKCHIALCRYPWIEYRRTSCHGQSTTLTATWLILGARTQSVQLSHNITVFTFWVCALVNGAKHLIAHSPGHQTLGQQHQGQRGQNGLPILCWGYTSSNSNLQMIQDEVAMILNSEVQMCLDQLC